MPVKDASTFDSQKSLQKLSAYLPGGTLFLYSLLERIFLPNDVLKTGCGDWERTGLAVSVSVMGAAAFFMSLVGVNQKGEWWMKNLNVPVLLHSLLSVIAFAAIVLPGQEVSKCFFNQGLPSFAQSLLPVVSLGFASVVAAALDKPTTSVGTGILSGWDMLSDKKDTKKMKKVENKTNFNVNAAANVFTAYAPTNTLMIWRAFESAIEGEMSNSQQCSTLTKIAIAMVMAVLLMMCFLSPFFEVRKAVPEKKKNDEQPEKKKNDELPEPLKWHIDWHFRLQSDKLTIITSAVQAILGAVSFVMLALFSAKSMSCFNLEQSQAGVLTSRIAPPVVSFVLVLVPAVLTLFIPGVKIVHAEVGSGKQNFEEEPVHEADRPMHTDDDN